MTKKMIKRFFFHFLGDWMVLLNMSVHTFLVEQLNFIYLSQYNSSLFQNINRIERH